MIVSTWSHIVFKTQFVGSKCAEQTLIFKFVLKNRELLRRCQFMVVPVFSMNLEGG